MNKSIDDQFDWWYQRVFLQSPNMCQLEYDDEKMWEAWKFAYNQGWIKGWEETKHEFKTISL